MDSLEVIVGIGDPPLEVVVMGQALSRPGVRALALRFVVLRHDWNGTHWDLMIEREPGGPLLTWAIERAITPGIPLPARRLVDHRSAYLDYEGEISGGRGFVVRWDQGTCEVWNDDGPGLILNFEGTHLTGRASLRTTSEGGDSGSAPGWVFVLGNSR